MRNLVQLSRNQWLVIAAFVVVTFPMIMLITFMPRIYDWYAVTSLAPDLERDLGFRTTIGEHDAWARTDIFFISEVNPGGAFDRAGLKAGDVPADVHHGRSDFYSLLESHRGRSVKIRILRLSVGPSDAFLVGHEFEVVVPGPAG